MLRPVDNKAPAIDTATIKTVVHDGKQYHFPSNIDINHELSHTPASTVKEENKKYLNTQSSFLLAAPQ
jgi:hypothetical protein